MNIIKRNLIYEDKKCNHFFVHVHNRLTPSLLGPFVIEKNAKKTQRK